jgi:hypothetical protein
MPNVDMRAAFSQRRKGIGAEAVEITQKRDC